MSMIFGENPEPVVPRSPTGPHPAAPRIGTLRELYPHRRQRHGLHYGFAFRGVTLMAWSAPGSFFREVASSPDLATTYVRWLWDVRYRRALGIRNEGDPIPGEVVTDLFGTFTEFDGYPALLIEMPEPPESPDAFYVLIMARLPIAELSDDSGARHVEAFALERAREQGDGEAPDRSVPAVVCGIEPERHANFGIGALPTVPKFLEAMDTAIGRKPSIISRPWDARRIDSNGV